jgi:hypothetical protein
VVTLTGETTTLAAFVAPVGPATLVFQLTVTDGFGGSDTDTVTVEIRANAGPVAHAGPDQTGVPAGTLVTLDGTGSVDPEGHSFTYAWSQLAGPAVTLSDPTAAQPTFTSPVTTLGTSLIFKLVATDQFGAVGPQDTVAITVLGNRAPVANAGLPFTAGRGALTALNGTASFDPDGHSISYQWVQTDSGGTNLSPIDPLFVTLSDPAVAQPTFTAPLTVGSLYFRLVVVDQYGVPSAPSDVIVSLTDNNAPIADPGAPQVGKFVNQLITLSGAAIDPDAGETFTYLWTQVDENHDPIDPESPLAVDLADPTAAVTTFTTPIINEAYVLYFQFDVEDALGEGSTAFTSVSVAANRGPTGLPNPTVSPAQAQRTINRWIQLTIGTAGSDPDGTSSSLFQYNWVQTDAAGNPCAPNCPVATVEIFEDGDPQPLGTTTTPLITPTPRQPLIQAPPFSAAGATLYFRAQVDDGFGAVTLSNVLTVALQNTNPTNNLAFVSSVSQTLIYRHGFNNEIVGSARSGSCGSNLHCQVYAGFPLTLDGTLAVSDADGPTAVSGVRPEYQFKPPFLVIINQAGVCNNVSPSGTDDPNIWSLSTPTATGNCVLQQRAIDVNGNASGWTDIHLNVKAYPGAPTASVAALPSRVFNSSPGAGDTMVTLDASASSTPSSNPTLPLGYTWVQIDPSTGDPIDDDHPDYVELIDATSSTPEFVVPDGGPRKLRFAVTVTDSNLIDTAESTVLRVVTRRPVAVAETSTPMVAPGEVVQVDAGDSSSPDGRELGYEWRQLSGPEIELDDFTAESATFEAPRPESGEAEDIVLELVVRDGFSARFAEVTVTVQPEVPAAPADAAAVAGEAAATVSWSAPADDGGSPITGYRVTSDPDGISVDVDDETLSTVVEGLTNDTEYTFTVVAINLIGDSEPSEPSNAVTPKAPTAPSAPRNVFATGGDARANVSWLAPLTTGGRPVTGYTVVANPGGATVQVGPATFSTQVEGLTNGETYTFTVIATNVIGDSVPSAPSGAVTPSAPLSGAVVENPGSVRWTVTGGELAIGEQAFALQECPGGVAPEGAECVAFTGSVDEDGNVTVPVDGISFPPIEFEAAPGVNVSVAIEPTGPATGVLIPATGEATLEFGINITVPELSCSIGPIELALTTGTSGGETGIAYDQADGTSLLVDGLYPLPSAPDCGGLGSVVNDALGLPSPSGQNYARLGLLADPVLTGTRVPGDDPVIDNPGPAQFVVTDGALSIGEQPFDLQDCPGGVPPEGAECVAFTGSVDGDGNVVIPAAGIVFPAIEFEAAPGVIVSVVIEPTGDGTGTLIPATGEATLEFGINITVPELSCSIGPIEISATTGSSGTETGIAYDQLTGEFTLVDGLFALPSAPDCGGLGSVVNDALGLPSPSGSNTARFGILVNPIFTGSGTPGGGGPEVPRAPRSVTAVPGNGQAAVSWLAPTSDGGSPITGYRVIANPGPVEVSVDGDTLSTVVAGLTNGTAYTFTVVATNDIGDSNPSNPSGSVTPIAPAPPAPPAPPTATAGNGNALVSWTAPTNVGTSPLTGYRVTVSPGGATIDVGANTTGVLVSDLVNGTEYTFTVIARNAVGDSAPSDPSDPVTPSAGGGGGGAIVDNPGLVTWTVTGGELAIGDQAFDLPGCPGGVAPEGESCVTFTGSVDANGNVTIPVSGISFPSLELDTGVIGVIEVFVVPSGPATGVLIPATGEATLSLGLNINVPTLPSCSIGPLNVSLTTGSSGTKTGVAYDQTDGTSVLVDGLYEIPEIPAAACGGLGGLVNGLLGLPSASGLNSAQFGLLADPIVTGTGTGEQPIVDNPGIAVWTVTGGELAIGDQAFDLPGCPGGVAPEGESCVTFTGSVDANGNVTIPVSGISFPSLELDTGVIGVIEVFVVPSGPATGVLIPATGEATLSLGLNINVPTLPSCSIGPLNVSLTTGSSGTKTGVAYDQTDGTSVLVDGLYEIPEIPAAACGGLGGLVNGLLGLPSASGLNSAQFGLLVSPVITGQGTDVVDPPGCAINPAPHGFSDVASNGSEQDLAARWLKACEITTGFGGSTTIFSPSSDVSRFQMSLFLFRMMDSPTGYPAHGFTDVPNDGSEQDLAARFLKANGITTGFGGNTTIFNPGGLVNRSQMSLFLHRMAGSPTGLPAHGFSDVVTDGSEQDLAARWLKANEITTGFGGNTAVFNPSGVVNRSQMSLFLFRLSNEQAAWAVPPPSTVSFG